MRFDWHNPVKVLFGEGRIADLAAEIPPGVRILVLSGGGSIRANGVYDQVAAALAGRDWAEFRGIGANPEYTVLMRAVEQVRSGGFGFLLAVGGGSVLDGTKFVAAAAPFAGDPWDICAAAAPVAAAVPLGAVLTLPATGSEMNGASVVSHAERGEKRYFISPLVLPRFAVLDPATTRSLPPRQVGNGIVDAWVHICEQYLVDRRGSEVQDRQAEALLLALRDLAPRVAAGRDDPAALAGMMWAATNALNGLIGVGVAQDWATHMIGHELTALTGMDHARTLAVVLPALLRHRRTVKGPRLLQYAERVWDLRDGPSDARIETAIARTEAFFHSVGVPTRLADHGIDAGIADRIADRLAGRGGLGEDGGIDAAAVRAILRGAA
ncbi:MAG: iron-containing alcohol dehydrogenase [Planctomycetota bacterium]|jgi:NADP-dependent alcohol dehydrogenase